MIGQCLVKLSFKIIDAKLIDSSSFFKDHDKYKILKCKKNLQKFSF